MDSTALGTGFIIVCALIIAGFIGYAIGHAETLAHQSHSVTVSLQ